MNNAYMFILCLSGCNIFGLRFYQILEGTKSYVEFDNTAKIPFGSSIRVYRYEDIPSQNYDELTIKNIISQLGNTSEIQNLKLIKILDTNIKTYLVIVGNKTELNTLIENINNDYDRKFMDIDSDVYNLN